jgi:glycine cleavage system regulatory protein
MTNMRDIQTCSVGDLHLILSAVALVDVEPVEVVCQMVSRPGIHVPVGVDCVGAGVRSVAGAVTVFLRLEGVVEALAALQGLMPEFAADLALDVVPSVAAATSLATAASLSTATTTIPIMVTSSSVGGGVNLPHRSLLLQA